jgi:hypothetical protein
VFDGPAWRPGLIGSWLVGFLLYEWLAQTQGLGFWSSFLGRLHPPSAGIGASLPGFAVSFTLAFAVARIGSGVHAASRRNRASLA